MPSSCSPVFARLALLALLTPIAVVAQTAITVQVAAERQLIDGFGASSAWTAKGITDEQADLFFSPTTGLGLSLLRVRIAPSGNTWETITAQKAVARGARVWATPWSPPGAWKTNGTDNYGGSLLPDYHDDWAARLAQFVVNMKNAGVPILALSAQNEPNWTAEWETCLWTPAALTAFVRDHLGPALVARGVTTRVLAPETIDWYSIDDYADALLGDAAARTFVSHVATHSYGGTAYAYATPAAAGLPFWQTEYSDGGASADSTITSGLRVAGVIHDFLTIAQGNAWHYWWLYPATDGGSSTSSLIEANAMTKRGWALGNWARFVRPGQRRLNTTGSTSTLRVTAFAPPTGRRLSVVVLNSATSSRSLTFTLTGGTAPSLTPWETSATRSLESLASVVANPNGTFSVTVPAQSITTFVGEALNRPPATLTLTTSAVTENQPVGTPVGRPQATDADVGDTFTYALVSGAGSADNALFTLSGGFLRTTAALDFEAAATRTVRLRVTDAAGGTLEQALIVTVVNDPAEYADWSATLPAQARGTDADPEGDGIANLFAYAFGFPAGQPIAAAALPAQILSLGTNAEREQILTFTLPAACPPDARYELQSSADLAAWSTLATKSGAATWSTALPLSTDLLGNDHVLVRAVAPPSAAPIFYRLRISLFP